MSAKPLEAAPSSNSAASGAGSWVDGPFGYETFLVHGAVKPDAATGAILTPIMQSTTFVQESIDAYCGKGYSYSRTRNPTVATLEEKIAKLENGVGACCFSTGMAATVTVMSAFLGAGDHCVITDCSYGGTNRAARIMFQKMGVEFSFVDFTNLKAIEAAIKPNTKLIFSETPVNPILKLCDIAAISQLAKSKNILHCCDGTFAPPCMMRALDLGADMALQSTTKYYDGHNMTVGGAVAAATKEIDEQLHFYQNIHGNIMSPMVAFFTLQTSKTMSLRLKQQSATAQKVAEFLHEHPNVEVVRYPGLPDFPQKELADRQHLNGMHGGMLWFEVKGGTAAGKKLMDTIQRPWSLCENLGAVESIITCPAVMTHANMLKEDREKVGITDGLVRVSCGIEDAEDLLRSLKVALDNL
jgi:cystathionine beta-lyase/cystathionine gamma-synthase|eukprot:CAMPEP_0174314280 /NCGR_PEP_ID=MMETSP0810-20121108/5540_1 /TAXON_ID=73025 ORGANISM="Eutreptiella gymnastica-like, Strain CCMP1594" /NCGR_SAMPLE_ID=MMETSP0810 /ASSEMBLY_ACC=CAM_ASM_000659 /LENGTH=412 /DNA_ID=CAMNT_0015423331 /DNA_START=28 /DNA_END=1266 /DNA_ORIENTATION=+